MDRKTYLEFEEVFKKIWFINKTIEKVSTAIESIKEDILKSDKNISTNLDSITKLQETVTNLELDTKTIENTLTDLSKNLVQESQKIKILQDQVYNENILINGDFKINQRGSTSYYTSGYTVDRWRNSNAYGLITKTDTGITFKASGGIAFLIQPIEETNFLWGKTVTMSMLDSTGYLHISTFTLPSVAPSSNQSFGSSVNTNGANVRMWFTASKGYLEFTIDLLDGYTITPVYCKLELGDTATKHTPIPYADEILMCQRYYESGQNYSITQLARSTNVLYNGYIPFKVQKRTTPTVACYSLNNAKNYLTNDNGSVNVGVNYGSISHSGFRVYSNAGGFTQDRLVYGGYIADAEI